MLAQKERPDQVSVDDATPVRPLRVGARLGAGTLLLGLLVLLGALSLWHLTQGSSGLGARDLLHWLTGDSEALGGVTTVDVLVGSRLPRLAAAVVVGFALGAAGALFQSVARNPLASPDTLAVTGGAYLAVTVVAVLGWQLPVWGSGLAAFVGGTAAAALVLALAGAGTAPTRLILAGAAMALVTQAATSTLLILFAEETTSLFAWGSGSLSQLGFSTVARVAPLVLLATLVALLGSRRLDLLSLGDDTASSLGVPVRSTRTVMVVVSVLLTAGAVTLAGPIGFVGLAAPVVVRLLGRWLPALQRHVLLVPAAGLTGALVVVGADVAVRAVLGVEESLRIPVGVTTTVLGGIVMVALARSRAGGGGAVRRPPVSRTVPSTSRVVLLVVVLLLALLGVALAGLLGGLTWLRTGDIGVWLAGDAPPLVAFALDERAPRVAAALLAGIALALSGTVVQATCRNPLAEPGLLGITAGAGLGAVIVVTGSASEAPSGSMVLVAGVIGALVTFAVVYLLAWRGGLDTERLVLVGIGVWYTVSAMSTFLLVRSNPWDTPRIYTWLSGTTYGRTLEQVWPVALVVLVSVPLAFVLRRELDLLALDDDTPRVVGVGLERVRLLVLSVAALLAATSVVAVGVVGFVGLLAPHAARALVGGSHARVLPVALLLGGVLVTLADLVGRTVIAPAQIPVGLLVALVGAPYFVWLLSRSRAA